MKRPRLDDLLTEHGLFKKGSKELQQRRVERFEHDLPTRKRWPPKTKLEFAHIEPRIRAGGFLSIPGNVITYLILPHLSALDVHSLMLTCTLFYKAYHKVAHKMAREFFATNGATPMAIGLYKYLIASKKLSLLLRSQILHTPPKLLSKKDARGCVIACINYNNCVENSKLAPQWHIEQEEAKVEENEFVQNGVQERREELELQLGFELGDSPWLKLLHTPNALNVINTKIDAYLHMKDSTMIDTILKHVFSPITRTDYVELLRRHNPNDIRIPRELVSAIIYHANNSSRTLDIIGTLMKASFTRPCSVVCVWDSERLLSIEEGEEYAMHKYKAYRLSWVKADFCGKILVYNCHMIKG